MSRTPTTPEASARLDLEEIRRALAGHRPHTLPVKERRQAGVSVVLRSRSRGAEVLLIERAEREGDPWSGHMAFPGGRIEPEDLDVRSAAERETFEEVGIRLAPADVLGRLDDLQGRHAGRELPLVISAFVYAVEDPGPIRTNEEVTETLWVPLGSLLDSERHVDYVYPLARGKARFPGIRVAEPDPHVVWGLTYRFLEHLLEILGRPLPDRW